jgi:HNH endonuclease/AP2 domain
VETAKYLLLIPLDKLATHSISNKDDKMAKNDLTQQQLKQQLHYDPESGIFTWVLNKYKTTIGKIAGSNNHGYIIIRVYYTRYFAHRLAWLYMTGEWPKHDVDHIDMDRKNNKWTNLREATRSQNKFNVNKFSTNTSGYKGVSFDKSRNKFTAQCMVNGKLYHLGRFLSAELASNAYQAFTKHHHGVFYRE